MERDSETGLSYHGARYYAPWLGRWTAADPIGLGDGVNRYRYSSNNPVGFVDRTGTFGQDPAEEEPAKPNADSIYVSVLTGNFGDFSQSDLENLSLDELREVRSAAEYGLELRRDAKDKVGTREFEAFLEGRTHVLVPIGSSGGRSAEVPIDDLLDKDFKSLIDEAERADFAVKAFEQRFNVLLEEYDESTFEGRQLREGKALIFSTFEKRVAGEDTSLTDEQVLQFGYLQVASDAFGGGDPLFSSIENRQSVETAQQEAEQRFIGRVRQDRTVFTDKVVGSLLAEKSFDANDASGTIERIGEVKRTAEKSLARLDKERQSFPGSHRIAGPDVLFDTIRERNRSTFLGQLPVAFGF